MRQDRPTILAVVLLVVLSGFASGIAVAQAPGHGGSGGPPGDGEPGGPPAATHERTLVVTNVTVEPGTNRIRVTVANPGPRPVTISTAEVEAVQNETVVESVRPVTTSVVSSISTSTTEVADTDAETANVLKDINFDEGEAIRNISVNKNKAPAVDEVFTSPLEVIDSITPETSALENVKGVRGKETPLVDAIEITASATNPADLTTEIIAKIEASQTQKPLVDLKRSSVAVVGEDGDWKLAPVVESVETNRSEFVDFVSVAVTERDEFLKRPSEFESGIDPTPFKQRTEVIGDLTPAQVLDGISSNKQPVVRTVLVSTKDITVTETSVWDASQMAGNQEIELGQRESVTLELEFNRTDALLAGTPPDLSSAVIVDGWLYDEHGGELVHFLARPGP